MCGIFAYLNFLTPKSRQEILEIMLNGLQVINWSSVHLTMSKLMSKGGGGEVNFFFYFPH